MAYHTTADPNINVLSGCRDDLTMLFVVSPDDNLFTNDRLLTINRVTCITTLPLHSSQPVIRVQIVQGLVSLGNNDDGVGFEDVCLRDQTTGVRTAFIA
jgi:hypothetical protein